jgi:general secretion pathway protein J
MFMFRKQPPSKGFTLLEIILALFIFSIISIVLIRGLHTVLTAQSATEKSAARFAKVQIALTLISRDFEQIIDRPITNSTGTLENSLIGNQTNVTFTHAGLVNPMGQLLRSTLQRTRYQATNGNLIRESWQVLDQAPNSLPSSRILLNNVTELHFEYLDKDGHFHNKWPPPENQQQAGTEMPKAIKIFIALQDWGKITQLYLIPGQKSAKPN